MGKEECGYLDFVKCLLLVLLYHGVGYQINYAVDTYYTFAMGFDYAANDMLYRNGRPVIALLYKMFSLTVLRNEMSYYLSFTLAIVCLTISIYLYQKILMPFIDNSNIRIVLSFVSIANIYIIEYFMFLEKGGFMLGILFSVIAVWYIERYFSKEGRVNLVGASVFIILAMMTYQPIAGLFFILAIPITYKKAINIADYIGKLVLMTALYMGPAVICVILFHTIFNNNRIYNGTIMNSMVIAAHMLKNSYVSSYGILPKYLYLLIFVVVVGLGTIRIVGIEDSNKRIFAFGNITFTIVAINVMSVASVFAGASWGCPRIIYIVSCGVGILAITIYVEEQENDDKRNVYRGVLDCAMLLLLLFKYMSFINIYCDKYTLNVADEMRCYQIGQAINKYEVETGNKITQITFYRDLNTQTPFYPRVFDNGDMIHSGLLEYDSQLYMINYYLGTSYTHGFPDIGYLEHFLQLDWTTFSDDQMLMEKDTLHYCVY